MVEAVLDPIRMPTITLTQTELDDIDAAMAAGALPPDWMDRYHAAVQANVFGHDHKTDRHGNPIEQGRGSASNQTAQSLAAYRKYGRDELGYAENLKRMEGELAASDKLRAEARAAAGAARRNAIGGKR